MMDDRPGAPRKNKGGMPQKWFLTDREYKLIDDLYDGSKEGIDLLQRQMPHIPRRIVQRFAMQMGKTRPRGYWEPEDEEFLRKNLRKMSMNELKKHLNKDKITIVRKAHRMGLYRENNGDGYTLADLMLGLGISNNHKIYEWIAKGWLKGKKTIVALKLDQWNFTAKDIREFVLAHPDQLNQHKFDWLWVADILSGDRGIGRLDNDKYTERTR
jgi:hypothetical protein